MTNSKNIMNGFENKFKLGYWIGVSTGRFSSFSLGFSDLTCSTYSEWLNLIFDEDKSLLPTTLEDFISNPPMSSSLRYRIKLNDHQLNWIETFFEVQYNQVSDQNEIVCYIRDMNREIKLEKELLETAFYSEITNLMNRKRLLDVMNHDILQNHNGAILLMHSPHIDSIRNTTDYSRFNCALQELSFRLTRAISSPNLVAQLEDYSFAILLRDLVNRKLLGILAEDLCSLLSQPLGQHETNKRLSFRVGIRIFSKKESDASQIIHDAYLSLFSTSLYDKSRYVFFDKHLRKHLSKIERFELDCFGRETSSNVTLHMCPIFSKKISEPYAYEVSTREYSDLLIMYYKSEANAVEVNQFLLTKSLQNTVDLALAELAKKSILHSDNMLLYLQVPIMLFNNQDFLRLLIEHLKKRGLPPERLILSLDRSSKYNDSYHRIIHNIKKASQIGLRIGIHDFGNGFNLNEKILGLPIEFVRISKAIILRSEGDTRKPELAKLVIKDLQERGFEVYLGNIDSMGLYNIYRNDSVDYWSGDYFTNK